MSSNKETNNTKNVNRFQDIVKTLNLKQSDIATKLNISRQYINNCYHGREKLSEEKLIEFAKIYNVNLHYYFTGEGKMFLNDQAITEEELAPALEEISEGLGDKQVVVKADKQTKSSEIMKVMRAAQDAGYEKLVVAGEPLSKIEQDELKNKDK